MRDRKLAHVLGPRRVFVPRACAQQLQAARAGSGDDSLPFLLSVARWRRLHALLHLEGYGNVEMDRRV